MNSCGLLGITYESSILELASCCGLYFERMRSGIGGQLDFVLGAKEDC